jgi:iron complex transport system substrate-binding protein
MADVEDLATVAIDCGLQLHRRIGPGLLESVYESLLAESLKRAGLVVERQVPVTIRLEDLVLKDAFRADLIVERSLLIEVKSLEKVAPIHSKQLLTYLRVSHRPLGLNFGGETFREGLRRIVNDHIGASSALEVNSVPPPRPS